MEVSVNQGNIGHTEVKVEFGSLYDKDVILKVDSIQPGMNIKFESDLIKKGDKSASDVTIVVDKDAPAGEHWISLVGIGSDGKDHNCTLKLTVISTPIEEPEPPEIKITSPLNGSQVGITEDVKGTQKNIPSDKALWIVILPHKTKNYHPVKEVYIQDDSSNFSVPAITIGGPENKTESFDIIAVLADNQAQKAFTDYLNKSAIIKIYPGIDRPEGTEEKSRVTVIRK